MRTFTTAVLLMVAGLAEAGQAAAQTPPPPPPAAAPPAAAAPAPPPPPAPAPMPPPPPPPPAAVVVAVPAPAPPAAPAAPTPPAMWYDKFSGDAFVDAYGAINWNMPKPQFGTTGLHAYDEAQGFSLNWVGLDASYAADPVGATVSLRFGPGALIYETPTDVNFGMEYVRQAYATVKPADKWTLDVGKFDQPFGSEVPDSQLNMEYTRSLLFNLNQPVFFTGLRLDYAPIDMIDAKIILANGWNNTIDNNRGKTIAAQLMVKPADAAIFYIGYAGGPEQTDFAGGNDVPDANSHWRHLIDFVADINPTKELRFLVNGDYDTEDFGGFNESWYGANIAIRYLVADPFQITLRGEYFHDEHGDIVALPATGPAAGPAVNVESATLTLQYVIASHFTLMLDNRIDVADQTLFASSTPGNFEKSQFTTTLGVIASTK